MKKALLVLLSLCVVFAMSCASSGEYTPKPTGPAAASTTTGDLGAIKFRMEDNFQWGTTYQVVIDNPMMLGGEQLAVGDKYTLKITYSASRDLEDKIQMIFVDTTEKANWWTELSVNSEETQIPASKAGEVVSATINFTITGESTGSSGKANALVIMTDGEGVTGRAGGGKMKAFTLDCSEFVLTKN